MVTGLEELEEDKLDTGWTRNRTAFGGYGFDGCVCGTATEGKQGIYTEEFNATKSKLRSLVNSLALEVPWHKPPVPWLSGVIRVAIKHLPRLFGNLSWPFRTIHDPLLSVGGYSQA